MTEYRGDENFRATSRLLDAAKSNAPHPNKPGKHIPAVNIAFSFPGSVFECMARPEHSWRVKAWCIYEAVRCHGNVSVGWQGMFL